MRLSERHHLRTRTRGRDVSLDEAAAVSLVRIWRRRCGVRAARPSVSADGSVVAQLSGQHLCDKSESRGGPVSEVT